MLTFSGIENLQGVPKRFNYSINLNNAVESIFHNINTEANSASKLLSNHLEAVNDLTPINKTEKTIDLLSNHKKAVNDLLINSSVNTTDSLAINKKLLNYQTEINEQIAGFYQNKTANRKNLKQQISHNYLILNIIEFLLTIDLNISFNIISILITKKPIAFKWQKIIPILLANNSIIPNKWQEEIASPNSFTNQLIDFIALVFLDQCSELPPQNIKLVFIPHKFPKHHWLNSELQSYLIYENWQSSELHASSIYLKQNLWQMLFNQDKNTQLKTESFIVSETTIPQNQTEQTIFNKSPADQIEIYDTNKKDAKKIELFSERPMDTLQNLILEIYQEHKFKGVIIFYALLRLIALTKSANELLKLNIDQLFDLLKISAKDKNLIWQIALLILTRMGKIEVIRSFNKDKLKLHTPLLSLWQYKFLYEKKIPLEIDLIIDQSLKFNSSTEKLTKTDNLGISSPFLLLCDDFFSKSIKIKYKEIIFLYPYICTKILVDFNTKQGVFEDSINNIIYGSNLGSSKKGNYRALYKLMNIIRYMKENNFIQDYHLVDSTENVILKNKLFINLNKFDFLQFQSLRQLV